jgi:flagellar biosynthesis protein FlhF
LSEALAQAKSALGEGLYVVGTHRHAPWVPLLDRDGMAEFYEVEAVAGPTYHEHLARLKNQPTEQALGRENLKIVHRVVSELEDRGTDPLKLWNVPSALMAPYQFLLHAGVSEEYAERIVRHAAACRDSRDLLDDSVAWEAVAEAVADGIATIGPAEIEPEMKRVILVVGPTGAGKTTSLAKMAAHLQLTGAGQVGLVSCDMFRIAAVEQLDTYARIMNMPFAAADSAQTVADAVAAMEADTILIDTPGRGPLDSEHLGVLAELSDVLTPDETHLVLPLESAGRWARMTADKFAVTRPDRLIVTKTDETDRHGGFIDLAAELRLPISFISTGQHVPQDFYAADPERISAMIMG